MFLANTPPEDVLLWTVGNVNILAALLIIPVSMLMAPVGVKIGSKLSGQTIRRLMVTFIFIGGVRVLLAPAL